MGKTAVDAQRAGTVFTLRPEDARFVLVNDKSSPLYDDRLDLPVSEELALSIAREGQIQAGKVRKNGPKLEILDGRQRYRAALLANQWIKAGDPRVSFRGGQEVQFKFEVVKPEDEADAVRKMLAANLRIDETPIIRAKRITRALKWGLTEEDVRVAYGFKTVATIKNILALLDCAPTVQKAVDQGEIPESVARKFADLDHNAQKDLLVEMREKGVMRGADAGRAVAQKKSGKTVAAKTVGKKMLTREFLTLYVEAVKEVPGSEVVVANLNFVLGDAEGARAAA